MIASSQQFNNLAAYQFNNIQFWQLSILVIFNYWFIKNVDFLLLIQNEKRQKKKIESPTTRTYQLRGCFDLKWAQFLSAPHSLISYLQIIWKKERGLVFRISQLYLTSESQKKIPIVVVIHYCAWYLFLRLRRYSI